MQSNAKKNKKGAQPIYKPYLRGRALCDVAVKRCWHVLGYTLIFTLFFVLVGSVLSFDSVALRIICNAALLLVAMSLMYNDGARTGENDTAFAEIALNRKNEGRNVPESELNRCFHPLKGFVTAAWGVLPIFIIALIYAFMAQKQTYSLGALPSWVSAYDDHADISQGLAYYNETSSVQVADILRIVVRLILFPFVTIAGSDHADALLLVDRLSPVLCLLTPACYGLGYMRGPYLRALVHGNIRMSKRRHNAKERKAREERVKQMELKNKKKELI